MTAGPNAISLRSAAAGSDPAATISAAAAIQNGVRRQLSERRRKAPASVRDATAVRVRRFVSSALSARTASFFVVK